AHRVRRARPEERYNPGRRGGGREDALLRAGPAPVGGPDRLRPQGDARGGGRSAVERGGADRRRQHPAARPPVRLPEHLPRPAGPAGGEVETRGGVGERPGGFPWAEYQRVCLGVLRWPPPAFWESTTWEVMHAWEGYAQSKGVSV